jgi:hypothetical protein
LRRTSRMMNGGTEQVHVLDHVSGKILSDVAPAD